MLSIGAVSRQTNVKIPTIRYYEQLGLLPAPQRSSGNQRRFSGKELKQLVFIKHARDLGLPLDAIRDLIRLGDHPDRSCESANGIATRHLESVRRRISRLRRLEEDLARIATGCHAGNVSECYVLHSLADHSLCHADH